MPREKTVKQKKDDSRKVGLSKDLPDDVIALIKQSKVDSRHDHLNYLLKDWKP